MNTLITYEWILDDMESRLQKSPPRLDDALRYAEAIFTLEHAMDYLFVTAPAWADLPTYNAVALLADAKERLLEESR